jgi:hypothetical protein
MVPVLLTPRGTVSGSTAVGWATPTETERSAWLAIGRSAITAQSETE